jgi:UDP-3-O-[3-hydroxymyristoyl] glucosamine N-acyltransferase
MRLGDVAALTESDLTRGDADGLVLGAAPLNRAGLGDVSFFDNPRYADDLASTRATACFCRERHTGMVPPDVGILRTTEPHRAYTRYLAEAYPAALRPRGSFGESGLRGVVHPEARLEDNVRVEPGAMIGARAEIGRGTIISAGTMIGEAVAIGRDCFIGTNVGIQFALIGDRVLIHPGACIGQDGFGFVLGSRGHAKVPQIGRVIIQDDVEIGANTTIDRGANGDTVIGQGTKIDNQVQIGHNVEIGRHCVIVAQVGVAGSTRLKDFVAVGGQAGFLGHLEVGDGAEIAAAAGVYDDIPPNARWAGRPAKPIKEWFRELRAIRKLVNRTGDRE